MPQWPTNRAFSLSSRQLTTAYAHASQLPTNNGYMISFKLLHQVIVRSFAQAASITYFFAAAGLTHATLAAPAQTPAPSANAAPATPATPAVPTPASAQSAPNVYGDEGRFFKNLVQLTTRDQFIRAGEAYFSPDANWIIFQAVETPKPATADQPAVDPDPFYAMYVAKFARDDNGAITGITDITRISPNGSANTCGWFDPKNPARVIYGSTLARPADQGQSGFQVGTRRYIWMFPKEMEIVEQFLFDLPKIATASRTARLSPIANRPVSPVFQLPLYTAECSISSDGRFLLYANVRTPKEGPNALNPKPDADIFVFDQVTKEHTPLISADGYDGGPFFSPDDAWLCYRSDRKGNDLLQIFIAELIRTKLGDGALSPSGIKAEYQLTNNEHVNWAPYWHPSQDFLVYASSEAGHTNYEIFAIPTPLAKIRMGMDTTMLTPIRVTSAPGADVLPVFSPNGSMLMWTSQRGPKLEKEPKPSSQLWIAEWIPGSVK